MKVFTRLRIFIKVVETGNFSKAARQLQMSQTSVSRQIRTLEEELKVVLLHRSTHTVHPTKAGRAYYEQVRHVVSDLDKANASVSHGEGPPCGVLTVSVAILFGQRLAPLLPKFQEKYPDIQLKLSITDRLVNLLEEDIDLALRMGPLRDSSLIVRKLIVNQFVVCGSPQYFQTYGVPRIPEDLIHHNCFAFKSRLSPSIWHFQGPKLKYKIPISGNLEAELVDVLLEGALSGKGITTLPSWMIAKEIERGLLQVVLPEYKFLLGGYNEVSIYAIYPDNRFMPPEVRVFIDFLVGELKVLETGI